MDNAGKARISDKEGAMASKALKVCEVVWKTVEWTLLATMVGGSVMYLSLLGWMVITSPHGGACLLMP
jgi:hypothetical protein